MGGFFPNSPKPKVSSGTSEPMGLVASGRSSLPDYHNTFIDSSKPQELHPEFAIEYLDVMESLAVWNGSFSQALDNIVQLGNTEHEIEFQKGVSDSLQREILQVIEEGENNWYEFGEGHSSLKGDLLTQLVVNGCLSAEPIPEKTKLLGVSNVVRVRPKNIRFVYDPKTTRHLPHQRLGLSSGGINGLRRLNTKTYTYIALRRYFESPYPTPPFMAAMRSLFIKDKMIDSFEHIMKMMGMLGFLEAKVKQPPKLPGEKDEQYYDRCFRHLQTVVQPQVEKSFSKGVVAGFMDGMEFNVTSSAGNAKGAEALMKIIDLTVLAALKQDPNMNGLNFSTTETFGAIIMEKMISQTGEYQKVCDSFFRKLYKLHLFLLGYDPMMIRMVKSKPPRVRDEKAKAESEEIMQRVHFGDYKQGLISQQDLAVARGYDQPDQDEPRYSEPNPEGGEDSDDKTDNPDDTEESDSNRLHPVLRVSAEYDYYIPPGCEDSSHESFSQVLKGRGSSLYKSYMKKSMAAYNSAVDLVAERVKARLKTIQEGTPLKSIQEAVLAAILVNWDEAYIYDQEAISSEAVQELYDFFRRDTKVFEKRPNSFSNDDFEIPDAVFDMDDFRAIQYFQSSDRLYLGKFINDEDTKRKLYKFIQEEHVNGNLPIGENPGEGFNKKFKGLLRGEAYKISRIIDTTTNRIRNNASVYYMSQAEVDKYQVVEINDNLTCEWCAHMDRMEFSVTDTMERLKKVSESDPAEVSKIAPFATSINISDFKSMTNDDLAKANMDVPAYHPKCRGFVTAIL